MNRRHTVLVVDDEPDVVASVKDLLRLDYKVIGATRAAEGIEILDREHVHVVMTDQRMPEMTGVQLLEKVRDRHPNAMRLLFTGYADVRAVVDAINRGNVYRYITKPWDPDELMAIIREACERYDLIEDRRNLIEELKDKNAELERANAELKQADELKAAFIRVASHELRTPLTILMGLADLATRKGNAAEPLAGWVKRIHAAGQRLQHLVDHIGEMLSAQQFERKLDKRPADVRQLVRQAIDDVRPFAEIRGQTLRLDLPDEPRIAEVDAAKIRDSVNHLLLNAIKFTPDQGTITATAGPGVGPDGVGVDGGAVIQVSDTGCGIDPESVRHVFDRFFTEFDVSRHSSGHFEYGKKGLGLGLSVVKSFVEMHGGQVEVESRVNQGTTFTIRLPGKG
jgi:signal transduction histidine kinase